jgi:hypothetical protein
MFSSDLMHFDNLVEVVDGYMRIDPVIVIDAPGGRTISMPDTAANQKHWPQPKTLSPASLAGALPSPLGDRAVFARHQNHHEDGHF